MQKGGKIMKKERGLNLASLNVNSGSLDVIEMPKSIRVIKSRENPQNQHEKDLEKEIAILLEQIKECKRKIRNLENGSTIKSIKAEFQADKEKMKKVINGYEERQQRYVKIIIRRGPALISLRRGVF